MTNILKHPAGELHDLIQEVQEVEFDNVVRLLIFALNNTLASGDVPDLVPDGPTTPPHATGDQRLLMEAALADHRRVTKQAMAELANQIAGFIERANQKRG